MERTTGWIKYPPTVALVFAGLVIALSKIVPQVSLTHDVAFYLILPPILFQGGLHLNLDQLRLDWKLIALLAIPGIVASALLVGYPLSYIWHIPLIYALLFGALISPTDPVSVLAIIKKIKAPQRLQTILEAESLFNDGTGVVLFMVILSMIQKNEPFNLWPALLQFLTVTGGGALVGGICGFLIHRSLKPFKSPLLELTLTIALVFGTPLIAESLHCSGIIAVVVAGLLMGGRNLSYQSTIGHNRTRDFWRIIDLILNSLIFLLIGIELQVIGVNNLIAYKAPILAGIFTVLISRAVVVYVTIYGVNQFLKSSIPPKWDHILLWGGLRGTIPIILMLQLPEFQYRQLFLSVTFAIVLFSIIVQGLTIEVLMKKLIHNHIS
jgi:CPA1 family monovalent cation:H+ antiporter